MSLCNCTQCLTYTTHLPNGPVAGRLISSRNKRKHQQTYLFKAKCNDLQTDSSSMSASESSDVCGLESQDLDVPYNEQESLPFLLAIFICWLHLICALSWNNC
ncbi:hypothetical protein O181_057063 [Austropuccinia psidii MF-1]|uniref:Uncharacterized protein n=1 Tax=Austropuccinia psidii MF-1 TaxID=1389203 RepID=A0A9Q3EEA5_9BASI|nr:hypothetical protein [Austropuccinia psidii MF-1]